MRLGDHNIRNLEDNLSGIDIRIEEFIKHEEYSKLTKQNDIALLRLAQPVEFTKNIRPACLAQSEVAVGSNGTATGWGTVEWQLSQGSDVLMKVQLNILGKVKAKISK